MIGISRLQSGQALSSAKKQSKKKHAQSFGLGDGAFDDPMPVHSSHETFSSSPVGDVSALLLFQEEGGGWFCSTDCF